MIQHRWVRGLGAAIIFGAIIIGFTFWPDVRMIATWLGLPRVTAPTSATPKEAVEWAQEIIRTGHQLVSYIWVLGAIGVGVVAAVSYYFFTWSTEHRELLRAMSTWQQTVKVAETAAIEAANRLPAAVFLDFKNADVRKRYEEELVRLRPEASPEEIDLHVQSVALLTEVPAEIYLRLGNYFRYRSHTRGDRQEMREHDLWFAIRRYERARAVTAGKRSRKARLARGHCAHGIAICMGTMKMNREALKYASEAVEVLGEIDTLSVAPALVTKGTVMMALGKLTEALEPLEDAADRSSEIVVRYNLACAYARIGDTLGERIPRERRYRQAIEAIESMAGTVASDRRRVELAKTDPDFNGLREDPNFGPVFAQAVTKLLEGG